ncbi:hypothetical protein JB92DRAFT_1534416 [Gautieria morchelliformis]|nr:hypothetical protein JB92DRAFT_1534416 [Gautieria morchelliformis]
MLLSNLARSFQYSRSLISLANTHRTLFYPSGPPPSPDSLRRGEFPPEPRAHIDLFEGIVDGEDRKTVSIGGTPADRWEQLATRRADQLPPSVHEGRTVLVRPSEGVGQAYYKLQGILRANNVRTELRLAERHEKKGTKRRRLRSERWRRKFADEKVKLVTEIRLRDLLSYYTSDNGFGLRTHECWLPDNCVWRS